MRSVGQRFPSLPFLCFAQICSCGYIMGSSISHRSLRYGTRLFHGKARSDTLPSVPRRSHCASPLEAFQYSLPAHGWSQTPPHGLVPAASLPCASPLFSLWRPGLSYVSCHYCRAAKQAIVIDVSAESIDKDENHRATPTASGEPVG